MRGFDDTIFGGDGNDHISSIGGNDLLYGGAGDDRMDGSNATLYGGDGHDRISGANSKLVGDSGNDFLTGDDFYRGNEVLVGGSGDDTLSGGEGSDSLDGGGGDDTYYFDRSDLFPSGGWDYILDFDFAFGIGNGDVIDLSDFYGLTWSDAVTGDPAQGVVMAKDAPGDWTYILGNVDDDPEAELRIAVQDFSDATIWEGEDHFIL